MVDHIKKLIRDVPDFPSEGIIYKDITPLLADEQQYKRSVQMMAELLEPYQPDELVAIESRGFIFGASLAILMDKPLQIARKPGKLPSKTHRFEYELEYGSDALEMHIDAIKPGVKYAVIDDVLATGGTASAVEQLVGNMGGDVVCSSFLIELSFLKGSSKVSAPISSLITY